MTASAAPMRISAVAITPALASQSFAASDDGAGVVAQAGVDGGGDRGDRGAAQTDQLGDGGGGGVGVAGAVHREQDALAGEAGTAGDHQDIAPGVAYDLGGGAAEQGAGQIAPVATAHDDQVHGAVLGLLHDLLEGVLAVAQQDLAVNARGGGTHLHRIEPGDGGALLLLQDHLSQTLVIQAGGQNGHHMQLAAAPLGQLDRLMDGPLAVLGAVHHQQ